MNVFDAVLVLASVPVDLGAGYLLLLTLASRRAPVRPPREPRVKFEIVIPAHDEEAGIAETVRSVSDVDYPVASRRVTVVADNCRDGTAERARAAGADVLVREDPDRRGKGYALAYAFERILSAGFADAVVVVDADTQVTPNLLRAFAARLEAGATAVQANNVVGNPDASWRTRLMAVAFSLVNTLRPLGRDRLGCSVGLHGNGMCLSTALLREVPHEAFSIVEDVEYGIRIGRAGHRVHFAHEGAVASVMVTSAGGARSQRLRWEGGRRALARRHGLSLVARGLARRDRILLDLGVDLLVPPLAALGASAAAGLAAAVLASALAGRPFVSTWAWGACVAALGVYVARGWWLSGTGLAGITALLHAPAYLVWKIGLALGARRERRDAWVRTERERKP